MTRISCDVAVIGGGPAGSAAAIALRRFGLSVLVLERQRFPRFHVGESLLPYQADLLERLGVAQAVQEIGFVPKYGARFITGDGETESSIDFQEFVPAKYGASLHVERAEFDALLLERAARAGAEVLEEHTVVRAEPDAPDGPTLEARRRGSDVPIRVRSRWIIDASGQRSFLARRLGTRRDNPSLKKVALFAHFEGASLPAEPRCEKTDLIFGDGAWFWLMPLRRGRVSVGAVLDHQRWRQEHEDAESRFARLIRETPALSARLGDAKRATDVLTVADFSYRARRFGGRGYLLAGDAACFLDPIFSTGVLLALASGELAGDLVGRALSRDRRPGRLTIRAYERRLRAWTGPYFRMIETFYHPEFRQVLFNPAPPVQRAVVELLAGQLDLSLRSRLLLRVFHLVVRLNRWLPLIRDSRPGLRLPHHA